MLGECKIAFSKRLIISDISKKEQHLLPPDRWALMTVSVCLHNLHINILWYSENYYCRACWQDVWLVSIRGYICGLKVNDNQFVTYISSSSQSLSSTASFPSIFLVHSSHSIFSSHLHLLPLQKKSTVLPVTSVENTITGGRRRVKASEIFFFDNVAEKPKVFWQF